MIDGTTYKSINQAALVNRCSANEIRRRIAQGQASFV